MYLCVLSSVIDRNREIGGRIYGVYRVVDIIMGLKRRIRGTRNRSRRRKMKRRRRNTRRRRKRRSRSRSRKRRWKR